MLGLWQKPLGAWGEEGDKKGHDFLLEALAKSRPDDAVLSEEDSHFLPSQRLSSRRTWIIDPLDGSHNFSANSPEWAVHVGLVTDNQPVAGAVALPALGQTYSTCPEKIGQLAETENTSPTIASPRSHSAALGAYHLAQELNGEMLICGSAGLKAMLVAEAKAEAYIHTARIYEWDACAPAAVAQAKGLFVSDAYGQPLQFNQEQPVLNGLLICRPELKELAVNTLKRIL